MMGNRFFAGMVNHFPGTGAPSGCLNNTLESNNLPGYSWMRWKSFSINGNVCRKPALRTFRDHMRSFKERPAGARLQDVDLPSSPEGGCLENGDSSGPRQASILPGMGYYRAANRPDSGSGRSRELRNALPRAGQMAAPEICHRLIQSVEEGRADRATIPAVRCRGVNACSASVPPSVCSCLCHSFRAGRA